MLFTDSKTEKLFKIEILTEFLKHYTIVIYVNINKQAMKIQRKAKSCCNTNHELAHRPGQKSLQSLMKSLPL